MVRKKKEDEDVFSEEDDRPRSTTRPFSGLSLFEVTQAIRREQHTRVSVEIAAWEKKSNENMPTNLASLSSLHGETHRMNARIGMHV